MNPLLHAGFYTNQKNRNEKENGTGIRRKHTRLAVYNSFILYRAELRKSVYRWSSGVHPLSRIEFEQLHQYPRRRGSAQWVSQWRSG
jgi:hypothetical protein